MKKLWIFAAITLFTLVISVPVQATDSGDIADYSPPSEGNFSEEFLIAKAIKKLILGYEITYSEAKAWLGKDGQEKTDLAWKVVENIRNTDSWILGNMNDQEALSLVLDMMNPRSYMLRRKASAIDGFQITPLLGN